MSQGVAAIATTNGTAMPASDTDAALCTLALK